MLCACGVTEVMPGYEPFESLGRKDF